MIQVSLCKTLAEFFKYMIANAYEIPKISFLQIFSHRYQTLTLPEEGSSSCMFVNGTLVHRCKEETPKCEAVRFREKKNNNKSLKSSFPFPLFMTLFCFLSPQVFSAKIDYPRKSVELSEFAKAQPFRPISSLFLLLRKSKHVRRL